MGSDHSGAPLGGAAGFPSWVRTFPALSQVEELVHGFVDRISAVQIDGDKDEALALLQPAHDEAVTVLGFDPNDQPWLGEQVHGDRIEEVRKGDSRPDGLLPDLDGFLTLGKGELLGIHVADCCAVYLVDPVTKSIALVHAGAAGAKAGIAAKAVQEMGARHGAKPEDLIVQLSPCIRPPAYPFDLPDAIHKQLLDAAVPKSSIHDCELCTHSDPEAFYSYRREMGKTGRHLALLGWKSPLPLGNSPSAI